MPDDPRPCIYRWRDVNERTHNEEMTVGQAIERGLNDMDRPTGDRHPVGIFHTDGVSIIVSQTRLGDLLQERHGVSDLG